MRLNIRKEIRKIQQALGITTIFVTHDQEEALSISDKVFVMRQGELMQGGKPEEIYLQPKNDFVAGFIGKSNILYGKVSDNNNGICEINIGDRKIYSKTNEDLPLGTDVWVSIRPQYIRIGNEANTKGMNEISGKINYIEYLGGLVKGELFISENLTLEFEQPVKGNSSPSLSRAQTITGSFEPEDVIIGRNIRRLD